MPLGGVADRRHGTRFFEPGFIQNFQWIFCLFCHCGADFGIFGAQHLKSRLQLNHEPVQKTHSAKVIKIPMTSKTQFLDPHRSYLEDPVPLDREP